MDRIRCEHNFRSSGRTRRTTATRIVTSISRDGCWRLLVGAALHGGHDMRQLCSDAVSCELRRERQIETDIIHVVSIVSCARLHGLNTVSVARTSFRRGTFFVLEAHSLWQLSPTSRTRPPVSRDRLLLGPRRRLVHRSAPSGYGCTPGFRQAGYSVQAPSPHASNVRFGCVPVAPRHRLLCIVLVPHTLQCAEEKKKKK